MRLLPVCSMTRFRLMTPFLLLAIVGAVSPAASIADEDASADPVKAVIPRFENLTLVGQFTIDRDADNPKPGKPERYEIAKVLPAAGGKYLVQSRIKYGQHDVTVPVPVEMLPAGKDSVVITLDDLTIPLLGSQFSARVVFDFNSNRYAGTWMHGKVGGHMWGRLEEAVAEEGAAEPE